MLLRPRRARQERLGTASVTSAELLLLTANHHRRVTSPRTAGRSPGEINPAKKPLRARRLGRRGRSRLAADEGLCRELSAQGLVRGISIENGNWRCCVLHDLRSELLPSRDSRIASRQIVLR